MYLYFTGKISSPVPQGLVAYQRPSRLLEREYVTLSSVSMDKKNVVSSFKWKRSANKACWLGLLL